MKQSLASKVPTHTREHPTVTKVLWMGQGKLGRGTQQQHNKATPHSPCQNEQTAGGMEFLHTWYVPVGSWRSRTNARKSFFFLFFYLLLVRYLPGLEISEIRKLFFRGPIRIRLKNSGSFASGRCRGRCTSRQDRRSTRVNDASVPRCRGLLQPAPPPVCSWLSKASLM